MILIGTVIIDISTHKIIIVLFLFASNKWCLFWYIITKTNEPMCIAAIISKMSWVEQQKMIRVFLDTSFRFLGSIRTRTSIVSSKLPPIYIKLIALNISSTSNWPAWYAGYFIHRLLYGITSKPVKKYEPKKQYWMNSNFRWCRKSWWLRSRHMSITTCLLASSRNRGLFWFQKLLRRWV